MVDLFATLGNLISSLGNVQSATVLKEHLALLNTQTKLLKDGFAKLEAENANLRNQISKLEQQLSAKAKAEEYVEERGAFFKRRSTGGYHNAVYCFSCHSSTSPFPPGPHGQFSCHCGWISSFTEHELTQILKGLPE